MTPLEKLSPAAQGFLARAMPFRDCEWGVQWTESSPEPDEATWAELVRGGWVQQARHGGAVTRGHGYMSEESSWMLSAVGSREMQKRYKDVYWSRFGKPDSDAEKMHAN